MFIHVVGRVDKRGAANRHFMSIPLPKIRAPENAPNCFLFFLIGFPAAGISELICFNFRPDLFASRKGEGGF